MGSGRAQDGGRLIDSHFVPAYPARNAARQATIPLLNLSPPMTDAFASDYADLSFQAIVEQSIVGVYVIQDECFVYSNATWAGFFGLTREQMTGRHLRDVVPPYFIDQSLNIVRRRIAGEIPTARYVTPGVHTAGHIVQVEVHGSRMDYRGRPAIVGVGIDVTERVQRDEELRKARNDLQALTAHINQDREQQRARFARELHDVLGGLLASMKMDATRILRRVENPELRGITSDLLALTQEAIDTVRDMSEELRPSGLDHLGLADTMRRELRQFAARYDIDCRLDTDGGALALTPDRATGIYRIFQEGLTNIAKHAQASHVQVQLRQQDGELHLEMHDDGTGLEPGSPRSNARGVLGMKERARDLGGVLELQTPTTGGTTLRLVVPVSP